MLVITGVGLGLSADSTIQSDSVDYWILHSDAASSAVVGTGSPKFGTAHADTDRLRSIDGVSYATPMLAQIIQIRATTSDEPRYVLAIGVIPSEETTTVAGLPTMSDPSGDPFFANGSYDGVWTGDVVLSSAAANLLNATASTQLRVFSTDPRVAANELTVTRVSEGANAQGLGQLPVALFRLSELQALTGADEGDQADQILVGTNSPSVEPTLREMYPDATVIPRTGITSEQVLSAELPLAMSITAVVIALAVGLLFVATTMGLEITAERRTLAILGAVGYPPRDRAVLMIAQTFGLTLIGGVLGVGLGYIGIGVANFSARATLGVDRVAIFHPVLGLVGVAIAIVIALFTAPYLYALTTRTNVLAEITR
jgi:putative ABC transport system permease protein